MVEAFYYVADNIRSCSGCQQDRDRKSAACADDTGYVGEYIDSSVFFHNSFNHIAAVICRRNIGFQEGNIALFFISDAFFSVFPCFLERCCYNKEK